ncbi:MAG: hypothetical protein VYD93_10115, partial [Actinomycetota bacterium]|nr:hypothetical protein [Actinomycetota bacterium]
ERKLLELRLLVEFQQLRRLISAQRRRSLPLEIPSPGVDHARPRTPQPLSPVVGDRHHRRRPVPPSPATGSAPPS